jgi:creatinine amidohydrolase
MRLDHATWPEIDAYLARSTGILVPVGSTEQHGPSGLIGIDSLCAEAIALAAGARLGALVGPVLPIGVADHHLSFAGSLSFGRETFLAALGDYARSLIRHGFRALYVVNGHGAIFPRFANGAAASRPTAPCGRERSTGGWGAGRRRSGAICSATRRAYTRRRARSR